MFQYTDAQEKWLQFMETTDLPQVPGRLVGVKKSKTSADEIGFCCLGLGCITLGLEMDKEKTCFLTGELDDYNEPVEIDDLLMAGTYKLLGLYSDDGKFVEPYLAEDGVEYWGLVSMNDSGRFTFKQIAAYIRSNPENVFKNKS